MAAAETDTTNPGKPEKAAAWPLAAVVGFVAMVHVIWWLLGDTVVAYGNLVDSDGYARLVRVERLLETGAWFDSSLPRANWPYGGALHWSRLFDMLLIALALPLMPALGVKAALYWSGALISPILHLFTAAAVVWAARPLIGRAGALIAGALTAVQFGVLGYATLGHADHHMLFGLIAVLAIGFSVHALTGTGPTGRHAACAGVVLAAGFWLGAEMQVTAALCLTVLGLKWVFEGDGGETVAAGARPGLNLSLNLSLGLLAGVAVALAVERGPGFFDVGYDRLSIVHLTLAALLAAFWWAVVRLAGRGPAGVPGRLAVAVAGAAAVLAVMWLLYPKVFVSPLKDFDPVILEIFDSVSEYGSIKDVPHFLLYAGASLIAGPWALWRLKTKTGGERWAWLLLAVSTLVYLVIALNWIRWSLYVGLFLAIALADLAVWVDGAANRRFPFPRRMLVKVPVVVLLTVGPLAAGTALVYAQGAQDRAINEARAPAPSLSEGGDPRLCPVQAMARYLEQPPWADRPRTILASVNFGAELLYRTRHRVTATLHHPQAPGILDSVRILGGVDDGEILKLVRQRQIDLILICELSAHDGYFLMGGGDRILYKRLGRGQFPEWIVEVGLPRDLREGFRLFEIVPSR
ncbi:MAG: hypothetical protein V3R79_01040 [Alphaproteobacteria bacterium]